MYGDKNKISKGLVLQGWKMGPKSWTIGKGGMSRSKEYDGIRFVEGGDG